jgi:hypothetical protein
MYCGKSGSRQRGYMTKKKKKKRHKRGEYSSVHQKIARMESGNTIVAKSFIKKLNDKWNRENV